MILVLMCLIGAVVVAYCNGSRVMRDPILRSKKR